MTRRFSTNLQNNVCLKPVHSWTGFFVLYKKMFCEYIKRCIFATEQTILNVEIYEWTIAKTIEFGS